MARVLPSRKRRYRLPPEWRRHGARRLPRAAEWRMGIWTGLLGGLLIFNVAAWVERPAASAEAPATLSERLSPAAVRVVDGDTFDYGEMRIRIADIDTPELRARCPEELVLARRATDRLRVLLAAGPFELRRLGRDEDRYGRKLRIVVRNGRSIGDMLVAEGLARTWTGRREPWC